MAFVPSMRSIFNGFIGTAPAFVQSLKLGGSIIRGADPLALVGNQSVPYCLFLFQRVYLGRFHSSLFKGLNRFTPVECIFVVCVIFVVKKEEEDIYIYIYIYIYMYIYIYCFVFLLELSILNFQIFNHSPLPPSISLCSIPLDYTTWTNPLTVGSRENPLMQLHDVAYRVWRYWVTCRHKFGCEHIANARYLLCRFCQGLTTNIGLDWPDLAVLPNRL